MVEARQCMRKRMSADAKMRPFYLSRWTLFPCPPPHDVRCAIRGAVHMARARPAVADALVRACIRRCELPKVLQDNAVRCAIADTWRTASANADRDGCPAV